MYFRACYIVRDFDLGDAQISASDPVKQIDVLISRRPSDETHPPAEQNQGGRNGNVPKRDAAEAS